MNKKITFLAFAKSGAGTALKGLAKELRPSPLRVLAPRGAAAASAPLDRKKARRESSDCLRCSFLGSVDIDELIEVVGDQAEINQGLLRREAVLGLKTVCEGGVQDHL
jgi:hypothetical protein